ncbi:MAG: hypothetical protein PVF28_05240 [Thioalkalispiraceae bacterium]
MSSIIQWLDETSLAGGEIIVANTTDDCETNTASASSEAINLDCCFALNMSFIITKSLYYTRVL